VSQRRTGLVPAERDAERQLRSLLRDPTKLAEATFNLVGRSVASIPSGNPSSGLLSSKVTRRLMLRLSNDLRAATRLACLGYAVQSAALIAGLYETALTVIHVGADENHARRWVEHTNPLIPAWKPKDLTRSIAARVGGGKVTAERLYRRYSQLCMAKHAHPFIEKQHVIPVAPGLVETSNGPDCSEYSQRTSWFALLHGVALALLAQRFFIRDHIPPGGPQDRLREAHALAETKWGELYGQAARRWSGKDPFPGKWARF
jgi:hypothetical protein